MDIDLNKMYKHLITFAAVVTLTNGYSQNRITGGQQTDTGFYLQYVDGSSIRAVEGNIIFGAIDTAENYMYYLKDVSDTTYDYADNIRIIAEIYPATMVLRNNLHTKAVDTIIPAISSFDRGELCETFDVLALQTYRDMGYNNQDVYLINLSTGVYKYMPSCFFIRFECINGFIFLTERIGHSEKPGYSILKENVYDMSFQLIKTLMVFEQLNEE
ncbi:MAG TPA: hypothetical protein VD908_18120 [Cytophagales bacterium]|nr:hypothetical protein [Cytophagales bacterium]